MLINEVCKECKLTKKAIDYYEEHGLIKLERDANGYRLFDSTEISLLKEISVLRKLGISISDIKVIITSTDKHKSLCDYKVKQEIQMYQLRAQQECLNHLLNSHYNIDDTINKIEQKLDENTTIKDKLLLAFPGNYGIYLALHFGRFLDSKIDSEEKVLAYYRIIEFLDSINNEFPEELGQFLSETFETLNHIDLKKMDDSMHKAINDTSHFLEENKSIFEDYIEYRQSKEFKSSPAYKMQQVLIDFQKSTGYYDVFIPNLKILSPSYTNYCKKLNLANEQFLVEFPQAKALYSL